MINNFNEQKIAIVGYAYQFPGDINSDDRLWSLLDEGLSVVSTIPEDRWDWRKLYSDDPDEPGKSYAIHGGFLSDIFNFDPEAFRINHRECLHMDPQQRLVLKTSWYALENSFIPIHSLRNEKVGVFIGATMDDFLQLQTRVNHGKNIDLYTHFGATLNNLAGRVSYIYGLRGPSLTIDTACSSSLAAVDAAVKSLMTGDSNLALAGGVNIILNEETYIKFSKTKMLSPRGKCSTFEDSADGYVRSEGCGFVVLQRLEDAIYDNRNILAVIRGIGANHNGRSSGLTVPSGEAQAELIMDCIEKSGLHVDDIAYLEAHGSGTQLGDKIEVDALMHVFNKRKVESPLWIGSVKPNLGHLESAAGIAGLIKVLLCMKQGYIPPMVHINKLNTKIEWNNRIIQVAQEKKAWNVCPRIAGISSFGASGTNAHMIVQQYEIKNIRKINSQAMAHLTISAKNPDSLRSLAIRFKDYVQNQSDMDIGEICRAQNISRSAYPYRKVIHGSDKSKFINDLDAIIHYDEYDKTVSATGEKAMGIYVFLKDTHTFTQLPNMLPEMRDMSYKFDAEVKFVCETLGLDAASDYPVNGHPLLLGFIFFASWVRFADTSGIAVDRYQVCPICIPAILFALGKIESEKTEQLVNLYQNGNAQVIEDLVKADNYHTNPIFCVGDVHDKSGIILDMDAIKNGMGWLQDFAVKCFEHGYDVKWQNFYHQGPISIDGLPNYAFREREFKPTDFIRLTDTIPFIPIEKDSYYINVAFEENRSTCTWMVMLNVDDPIIAQHGIGTHKTLAGSVQVCLATKLLEHRYAQTQYHLSGWTFVERIDVICTPKIRIRIQSNEPDLGFLEAHDEKENTWVIKSTFTVLQSDSCKIPHVDIYDTEYCKEYDNQHFYEQMERAGFDFGKKYSLLNHIRSDSKGQTIEATLNKGDDIPCILDAASQLLYLTKEIDVTLFRPLPFHFESFKKLNEIATADTVRAVIRTNAGNVIFADLLILSNGRPVAVYEGYALAETTISVEAVCGNPLTFENRIIYHHDIQVYDGSLVDHKIYKHVTIPGAYFISQAMHLASNVLNMDIFTLYDIEFTQAIVLNYEVSVGQVIVLQRESDEARLEFLYRLNESDAYTNNATLMIRSAGLSSKMALPVSLSNMDTALQLTYDDVMQYHTVAGLHLGNAFNWIRHTYIDGPYLTFRLYNPCFHDLKQEHGIPVGLIDTVVQAIGLAQNMVKRGVFVPLSIGEINVFAPLRNGMIGIVHIKTFQEQLIVGDAVFYSDDNEEVINFKEVTLIQTHAEKFGLTKRKESLPIYGTDWISIKKAEISDYRSIANKTIVEIRYATQSNAIILTTYDSGTPSLCIQDKWVFENVEEDSEAFLNVLDNTECDTIIVYTPPITKCCEDPTVIVDICRNRTVVLVEVLKRLYGMGSKVESVYVYTHSLHCVLGSEKVWDYPSALLWGWFRSLRLECPDLSIYLIDGDVDWKKIHLDVIFGISASAYEDTAIRNGKFYRPVIKQRIQERTRDRLVINAIKTYVLIGGFGGIGKHVCSFLIEKGAKSLIVIGKSALIDKHSEYIADMKEYDVTIMYYQIDVSKPDGMLLDALSNQRNIIGGVFYMAGVLSDKVFMHIRPEDAEIVYAAKIAGLLHTIRALNGIAFDYLVCFSSVVASLGSAGQSLYGAANSVLNTICERYNSEGRPVFSIEWGPWDTVGMFSNLNKKHAERFFKREMDALAQKQGIDLLEKAILYAANSIAVKFTHRNNEHIEGCDDLYASECAVDTTHSDYSANPKCLILNIVKSAMGMASSVFLDTDETFSNLGIDSLITIEIREKLNKQFNVSIPLKVFFEDMTIQKLTECIIYATNTDDTVSGTI